MNMVKSELCRDKIDTNLNFSLLSLNVVGSLIWDAELFTHNRIMKVYSCIMAYL